MSDLLARAKLACPSCGGESVWNPGKGCLVCPFCGTSTPVEEKDGEIVENDLARALRDLPDDARGWGVEKRSVKCRHCQAISVFDEGKVGQRCEFCGSSQLVAYEEIKAPFTPEGILALKLAEPDVRERLKGWLKSVWFAPSNLTSTALADTLHGIYLPFWTFDAQVEADWTAEAGFHYYTEESYTDSNGNRATRRVQRTRWEPASGHVSHFFDDTLVPASRGVDSTLLRRVEPFPTANLTPYVPSYVSGWTVEHYQIDLIEAAKSAADRMTGETRSMASSQVPGDTQRNLEVYPEFSARTFKHILAPVWLVTYTYGSTSYQVVVNGVTGAVAGAYPKSWVKIFFAILGALIVLGIVLSVIGNRG